MENLIISVASSLTLSGVLTAALIFLSKNWISERLKKSIEHEYAQKLVAYKSKLEAEQEILVERLRASHSRELAIQSLASTSFTESHGAAHERRLKAIETTWRAILRLREMTPQILTVLDIMPPDLYHRALDETKLKNMMDQLSYEILSSALSNLAAVEEIRPFVGEYIYSLFLSCTSIVTTTTLFLIRCRESREMRLWYEDETVLRLIRQVTTEDEFQKFSSAKIERFKLIQSLIEQKILAQVNRIISGEESKYLALEQSGQIIDVASSIMNKSNRA